MAVLHAGSVPSIDLEAWTFAVSGEVENWSRSLGRQRAAADGAHPGHHCVTRWSKFDMTFEGIHWRELEVFVRPKPSARFAIAHAEQGFIANVPISFLDEHALLATHANGEPLSAEHGYPLRLVIPGKYFWKSAKWLRGIELSATDKPGFWERYGYHNDADPFREERHQFDARPDSLVRVTTALTTDADIWGTHSP